MFLHPFFKGFSKILVIKKLWSILDFFYTLQTFKRPVPYHMLRKKNLNYYLLKVKKCHGDSVKNKSANKRAKHTREGGACLGLK